MLKQNNQKLLFFAILLTIGIFSNMLSIANASINSGIEVNLSISEPPALNETAELTLSVTTVRDVSNISVKIMLPEGLEILSGDLLWQGKLAKNQKKSVHANVKAVKTGNWTIIGAATGGTDYIYFWECILFC